ncbi:60S ribosomal protein L4 [Larimichthys crocea]|uniref:Uncharacterized protein n=2 Tax=Larimichthys crocea TaxID=215358 RepID=A0ACD3QD82_LARCR|nr:60S ribosomal protein L4 [Larimichthys crocea]
MTNTDLSRILKSEEIQKALRTPNKKINRRVLKKNAQDNQHRPEQDPEEREDPGRTLHTQLNQLQSTEGESSEGL